MNKEREYVTRPCVDSDSDEVNFTHPDHIAIASDIMIRFRNRDNFANVIHQINRYEEMLDEKERTIRNEISKLQKQLSNIDKELGVFSQVRTVCYLAEAKVRSLSETREKFSDI